MSDRRIGLSAALSATALAFALAAPAPAFAQVRDAQPVTVENSVLNPVPVLIPPDTKLCADPDCPTVTRREGDLNPFQWQWRLSAPKPPASDASYYDSKAFVVPDGMRLVIEFVSGHGEFPIDLQLSQAHKKSNAIARHEPVGGLMVQTTVAGVTADYRIPFEFQGVQLWPTGNIDQPIGPLPVHYVASDQVRLYADPGSEVVVRIMVNRRVYANANAIVDVSLSGYLVPVDP